MIKFYEAGIAEMWRDNNDPKIQALSYALQQSLKWFHETLQSSLIYTNIDGISEKVLDYMALELRAMYYDTGKSIETKREIIKNTLKWYMRAGTTSTTKELSEVIFDDGTWANVVEWYNFEDFPFIPGTFDIETDARVTPGIYTDLEKYLERAKNARSHLRKIKFKREQEAPECFSGGCVFEDKTGFGLTYLNESYTEELQDVNVFSKFVIDEKEIVIN